MTAPLLLGIETGGTKIQVGVGRGDGEIIHLERRGVDPSRGSAGVLDSVLEGFASIPEEYRRNIVSAGIGFGGPVDARTGRTTVSHQVSGWNDFPLADWARDRLGIAKVTVHNDADTAALGEARFGAGVGCSPVLYVNSGSGVGGGLILDGRIYRGAGQGALEIGHLWLDDPDTPSPSEPGVLERIASGWAIGAAARRELLACGILHDPSSYLARVVQGDPSKLTAEHVVEAAEQGDPLARAVLTRASRAMARGIAHAITLLAPRRVILGGGVSLMPPQYWMEPIRQAVDRLVFPPFRGHYDIVPAALGESVVVHGALALALDTLAA